MTANGGERVAEFAIFCGGVANAISRKQRKIERPGNCDGGAVASFFFPVEMALQLDKHIFAAKHSNQLLNLLAGFFDAAMLQSGRQRAVRAAGQADQTAGMLFQFFLADRTLAFFSAQLHLGDHAAEVLIAGAGGNEKRKTEFTTPW